MDVILGQNESNYKWCFWTKVFFFLLRRWCRRSRWPMLGAGLRSRALTDFRAKQWNWQTDCARHQLASTHTHTHDIVTICFFSYFIFFFLLFTRLPLVNTSFYGYCYCYDSILFFHVDDAATERTIFWIIKAQNTLCTYYDGWNTVACRLQQGHNFTHPISQLFLHVSFQAVNVWCLKRFEWGERERERGESGARINPDSTSTRYT